MKGEYKYFSLSICTLDQLTNNGVVTGQPLNFSRTASTLLLQKSATPNSEDGCNASDIAYSLENAQSWMTITSTGPDNVTLSLALTSSVAFGDYTFTYKMTYSTVLNTQKFPMHEVSYTIMITIIDCSNQTLSTPITWIVSEG